MPDETSPAPSPGAAAITPASTYGSWYYTNYESGPYERNEKWLGLFRSFAQHIAQDLAPRTALDAGCAIGLLVEALREVDIEAYGIDISEFAISQVDERVAEYCSQGSLTDPLPQSYDLICCIEVMEHLAPDDAEKAIANLCAATDRILFSSAPEDYAEPSHINLRPPEDWSVSFARHGFVRDVTYNAAYLSPWAVLYTRANPTLASVVRDYDRAHYRLHREVNALRASIVDMENALDEAHAGRFPELSAARRRRTEAEAQLDQLRELHDDLQARHLELARERDAVKAQLVRVRDLLIGTERELGGARGRMVELDNELRQYGDLPARYQEVVSSTSWRLMWKLMGPYRRVQRLRGGTPPDA